MPKRPAKHQIEDISRAKFQLTLPRTWIFRNVTPDYGIDGEVEVFDEGGVSTGLTFLVQLKATEDKKNSKRRRIVLSKEQVIYYRKRQPPVLIVRYDHIDDAIFYRWAGYLDLYASKPKAKTVSFVFNEDEVWRDNTSHILVNDLNRNMRLFSGRLNYPLNVNLVMRPEVTSYCSATLLRSAVGVAMGGNASNFLKLSSDLEDKFDVKVVISEEELNVIIGCGAGFTLHKLSLSKNAVSMDDLANLIIAAIAISFYYFGQNGLSSRLILGGAFDLLDNLPSSIVLLLLKALLKAGHFEKAFEFSDRYFLGDEHQVEEIYFRVAAMKISRDFSRNERSRFKQYLCDRLREAQIIGIQTQIGTAHYNLANYLKGAKEFSWAVHHYKNAARNAADYLKKKYFHSELAGVLFSGGGFQLAAIFYENAMRIEPDSRTNFLLADALMFAGEYEKSLIKFDEILKVSSPHYAESRLKSLILTHIVKERGVLRQKRFKGRATSLVLYQEGVPEIERRESYESAFKADALCPLAWFNFGVTYAEKAKEQIDIDGEQDEGNWFNAYAGFLAAGLIETSDIEAWSNAILSAMNHKVLWGQIPLTAECAYFFMGDQFLKKISEEILERMGVCEASENFLKLLDGAALKAKEERDDPIEIRVLGDHGNVDYILKN